jgi:Rgg/GadR/MutR family transcriptional activator
MNYGEALKNLRKSKHFTQGELVAGLSSQANLSHFENRNSNIPLTTLVAMLDRMNVQPAEYFMMVDDPRLQAKQDLARRAASATRHQTDFNHFRREALAAYEETGDIFYFVYATRVAGVYTRLNNLDLSVYQDDFDRVKAYLLQVKKWAIFEASTFLDLMFIFDDDFLSDIHAQMILTLSQLPLVENTRQHFRRVYAFNGVTIAFERGNFTSVPTYLSMLEISDKQPDQFYWRLMMRIYEDLYYLTKDDKQPERYHAIWQRIDMLKTLDFHDAAADTETLVRQTLNKVQ